MAYPRRLLTDDEEIVKEFHPHWRVLLVAILWVVVAVAAAVIAIWLFDDVWTWVLLGVAVLAVLLLALPRYVTWWFKLYVLTTERIVVREGVIRRGSVEIPLESINNVIFSQSIVERLLGYGDVLIESAGSQGQSRLADIPDPEAFQSQVYRIREARSMHLQGTAAPRDAVAQLEALAALHERGVLSDEEFAAKKAKLLEEI